MQNTAITSLSFLEEQEQNKTVLWEVTCLPGQKYSTWWNLECNECEEQIKDELHIMFETLLKLSTLLETIIFTFKDHYFQKLLN